ncbi:hypothetical protein ACIBMZ_25810 [Micromonospora sp. NPDC049900]|uniref:hypothetical protein n=1 Tax=Micromonospora sp. NPDC049900 TaxID=3364275 RepID=UPI00378F7290
MPGEHMCREIMVVPGRFVLTGAMVQEGHSIALALSIATPSPAEGTLVHLVEESPQSAVGLAYLQGQPLADGLVLVPWDIDRWASGPRRLPDDAQALGGLADRYRMQVQVQVGTARPEQSGLVDRLVPVDAGGRESSWDDAVAVRVLPWPQVAGRMALRAAYERVMAGEEPGRGRLAALLDDVATIQRGLRVPIPPGSLAAAVHLARSGSETQATELARRLLPVAVNRLPELVGGVAEPVEADALLDALRSTPDSAALVWFRQPGGAPSVAWLLADETGVRWIGSPEPDGTPLDTMLDDWHIAALRDGTTAVFLDVSGRPLRLPAAAETVQLRAEAAPAGGQFPGAWTVAAGSTGYERVLPVEITGSPVDPSEDPVSFDGLRQDDDYWESMWQGGAGSSTAPMDVDTTLDPALLPVIDRDGPWQPPEEAASSAMLRNGTMPVKGRRVWLRHKDDNVMVNYWTDDTRVWVLLPDGRRIMVVYPSPVLGSDRTPARVIGSWEREPNALAAAARPGTLDGQRRLSVDSKVVPVGLLEARAEVEYRYDATTVWVRTQDGRKAMVTYPYPVFNPAAAGPLVVEGWPRQPGARAEFANSKLAQGQVRVNNRFVFLGRKYPDAPVAYTHDATTVWMRLPSDKRVMVTYPYPVFDPADRKPVVEEGWPREPSEQAAMARLGTVSATGQMWVDRLYLYFGKKFGGASTRGLVAYRFDETTVWVRWPDGRKAMVTFPYPAAAPAAAGPVVVDGWRDPDHLMYDPVGPGGLLEWGGSPVEPGRAPGELPGEAPVPSDGLRQDDEPWESTQHGGGEPPAVLMDHAVPMDLDKTMDQAVPMDQDRTMSPAAMSPAMSIGDLIDMAMTDSPPATAADAGDAEPGVGEPSQPGDERWQPPRRAPSTGKIVKTDLPIEGRRVRLRSSHTGATVEYWADGTTVWVRLPGDTQVMVVYPNPLFSPSRTRPRLLEGWPQQPSESAVARPGTVSANGELVVDSRRVTLGGHIPASSEVEYRYDATTVWVRTPDDNKIMVVFPYPVFDPAAAGPEVVESWPRQPGPTAEFDTTKLSAGRFWVNNRRLDLGYKRFPNVPIEYTHDATTVWVRLPDGRRAMLTYPNPILDPADAGRVVVEGWPQDPSATARFDSGRLAQGSLRVRDLAVPLGVNYPDSRVDVWSDTDTVWVRWPDGRGIMVTYPYPVFDPIAGRRVLEEGWSREPGDHATVARLTTLDHSGRLQVDGRRVELRQVARDLPPGPVAYRYDATTVWVRARNGKKAQITYPYPAFDPGTAGPVLVNGWRDPNHLMNDPIGPNGLLEWDGSPVDPDEDPVSFDVLHQDDDYWNSMWQGGETASSDPTDPGVTMDPTAMSVVDPVALSVVNLADLSMADAPALSAVDAGDAETVVGEPSQPRDERWQPPREAPSVGKLRNGNLSIRGRDVRMGSRVSGVTAEFWADGTTAWVRLPEDKRVTIVYPNPVFTPTSVRPRIVEGWLRQPSDLAVVRTGTVTAHGALTIDGRQIPFAKRVPARSEVEYRYDAATVWVRTPDDKKIMAVFPYPVFDPAAAGPEVVESWPRQPGPTAEFDTTKLSAGRFWVNLRRMDLGLRRFPDTTIEYTHDATTVWVRLPDGRRAMLTYPNPILDPAGAERVVEEGWPQDPGTAARLDSGRLAQGVLRLRDLAVPLGTNYPDGNVELWSDANTVWVRWPDGRGIMVTYPYPVLDPIAGRRVLEEGWSREPGDHATVARLTTLDHSGRLQVGGRRVELRRVARDLPPGPVAYRYDATTVWVRARNGKKAQITYPYPAFDPGTAGPVLVNGWRDPNHLMNDPIGPNGLLEWDGSPVDPDEDPVSFDVLHQDDDYWNSMWQGGETWLGASARTQAGADVPEGAAVAEPLVGRGRRGVAVDRGVLVVGAMARWREWSEASAVVAAAGSSVRPVVVVDVGEGLGPRSAALSALGMVLVQFGRRRVQPLVVATGLVFEVTAVVGRYGLPVIGPDGAGSDARWQVVGPDGVVHWSAREFSLASFAAAGAVSSSGVQRAGSELLAEWLAQPDWPAAERFLRENTSDLLQPQIRQELVGLSEQDPNNRLLPAFTALLDLVRESGHAVDPAASRYRAPEKPGPHSVEPFDGVRGPLSVTFALDYLDPKPDPSHRRPWDDRLLRLMYLDPRARDLAAPLAAGVLGEQRGRVDDGRWNATVFAAVATVLRMTVEQAEEPESVDAWGKALNDLLACREADPEHRMYWIPRMDELRDLVSTNGVPGWINAPAPEHGRLLNVLTGALVTC